MNRELPLVSVALPTYNRVENLRRAVDSVLGQSYPNIELIISDNASTDDTQLLCSSYSKNYKQIKYHRQIQNIGAAKNFEFVREAVRGKYFMWLADDDYISPEFIEVCVAHLEADEDVALAAGITFLILDDGTHVRQRSFSLEMNSGAARAV